MTDQKATYEKKRLPCGNCKANHEKHHTKQDALETSHDLI